MEPPTNLLFRFFDIMTGWWLSHPSEKYWSIGMMTFPIYGNITNVPNHQPDDYHSHMQIRIRKFTRKFTSRHRSDPLMPTTYVNSES